MLRVSSQRRASIRDRRKDSPWPTFPIERARLRRLIPRSGLDIRQFGRILDRMGCDAIFTLPMRREAGLSSPEPDVASASNAKGPSEYYCFDWRQHLLARKAHRIRRPRESGDLEVGSPCHESMGPRFRGDYGRLIGRPLGLGDQRGGCNTYFQTASKCRAACRLLSSRPVDLKPCIDVIWT